MKDKTIAFDIETIADPAMIEFLPEVQPDSRLKDPVKVDADIAAKKKAQVAGMGLDPMTSIICCIGWATADDTGAVMLTGNDEKELLLAWWEHAKDFEKFVSFNGRSFDMRHILLHGMAHGVRPSVNIDKGRYNKGNHIDLRQILAGEDKFAHGRLDFFGKKFLKTGKTEGIDGSKVQEFWDMNLYDDIAQYCQDDCRITYDLWVMAEAAGLLE